MQTDGIEIGRFKVRRLMQELGLVSKQSGSQFELLDKLDYRVSDELLMSLLQVDGYNYLREKVN